ncbi:MAG: phosphoribosylformylglycinamidine cyclo-ligase [Sphingomonadales bacterium]|nr:phosphoribosylformylglycinamidine cyclo-ligase [Sphingomonadales bacterium]
MNSGSADSRYAARGVSATKEEVHHAIAGLDKGLFPSAFCKVLPDVLGNDPDFCNLIHADGAGTKSSLAYLYWKETGNVEVWKGIARDAVVMNLDDLCCAGATGPYLLSSTIGRNKYRISGEVIEALIQGTEEYTEDLRKWGLDIRSGGGETADLGDLIQTVVVDSTMTARMRRDAVVTNHRIRPGDVIVGFASFGTCVYETKENSGIGSNGLTSARHDLLHHDYLLRYPESVDASVNSSLQYSGHLHLTQDLNAVLVSSLGISSYPNRDGLDFGRWLLSPTRTYAPLIRSMLQDLGPTRMHGMVHCSGGGQTKVLHFVKDLRVVKDDCFEVPPLFALIQKISGTSWQEMYRVFNMGHRFEVYLPENLVTPVLEWGKHYGIEAKVVGRVEEAISSRRESSMTSVGASDTVGNEMVFSAGLELKGPEGILRYSA